jgi:hypothetical protein
MPLIFTAAEVRFEDECTVEDAQPLLEFLNGGESREADLSACTYLHTALLQLLLAARPTMTAPPSDPNLARWVAPLLSGPMPGSRSPGGLLADAQERAPDR